MTDSVHLQMDDGVAMLRLDRPPANAIDLPLASELRMALDAADAEGVAAIVIWGGQKIFAAGADIKAMADWGPEEMRPSVEALAGVCDALESSRAISIAAVNGFALGGGCELALACDLRYLAEDARMGQPEISLGVIPGAGGTQRLTRLVGPGRARELVYSGRQVGAVEAISLGMAERVLPAADLYGAAVEEARRLARGPHMALAAAKAAINAAIQTPGPAGHARERELFLALFGGPDQREGMRAFLEKRAPRFGIDDPV